MVMSRRRWLLLLAVTSLVATAMLWTRRLDEARGDAWVAAPPELQAVLWPAAHPVAPFRMRNQHGVEFGSEQLRGQWSFLFFGYLQCPDVCPTTLQALAQFRHALIAAEPGASQYHFVFVTVDPDHDDATRLSGYLAYFDPEFVGLVPAPDQLAALARSLGVAYGEHVDAQGVRSMDHSTSVVLVDPDGRAVGALPAPHDPAQMLRLFRQLQTHLGGG